MAQKPLSQVSLDAGPSGGGGNAGNVLIQTIAQDMAAQTQKSIANMQKLAQESMQLQQQTAQQIGGQVTESLNQVVKAQQAKAASQERKDENAEDRVFQEDMARMQADIQKEMQQDVQRVAAQIQGQRSAIDLWIGTFESKKDHARASIAAARTQLEDLENSGHFDQFPDGLERYSKIKKTLMAAESMRDDHFADDNIAEAMGLLNKSINDIVSGLPADDLTHLKVDPFLVPNPAIIRKGRTVPQMSGKELFELRQTDGYPDGGIFFGDNPYEGTDREAPFIDTELMRDILFYDSTLSQMTDSRARRTYMDHLKRNAVKMDQKLRPMMEYRRQVNTLFNEQAPQAVQNAVREFMTLQDPRKYQNLPRTMYAMAVRNMFPEKGDQMAKLALDVFEGREKIDTEQEYFLIAALESASFKIHEFITDSFLSTKSLDKDGNLQGLASQMVEQMRAEMDDEGVKLALGLPSDVDLNSGTGVILSAQALTRQMKMTRSYAGRVAQGFERSGLLQRFKKDYGRSLRMADVLLMHTMMSEAADSEAIEDILDKAASQSVSQFEEGEVPTLGNTPAFNKTINLIDAYLATAEAGGPDTLKAITNMLSGGALDEELTSPNFPGYKSGNSSRGSDSTYRDNMTKFVSDSVGRRAALKAEKEAKIKAQKKAQEEFGVLGGAAQAVGQQAQEVGSNIGKAAEAMTNIPAVTVDFIEEAGKFLFGTKAIDFLGEGIHQAQRGNQEGG